MILEATPFTTEDEMAALLSQLGVDLRVANPPGSPAIEDWYISNGTSTVWFYVSASGTAEELAACPWVRMCATAHAAMSLSGHGGEPMNTSLVARWESFLPLLQMILEKRATPPGIVRATNLDGSINVENFAVDMQMLPNIRRVRQASTDNPTGYRPPNHYPTQGWPRQ